MPESRFPGPALTEAQGGRRHWCLDLSEALLLSDPPKVSHVWAAIKTLEMLL